MDRSCHFVLVKIHNTRVLKEIFFIKSDKELQKFGGEYIGEN